MSTRDIQAHLHELYGTDVSHELISKATEGVLELFREWQTCPLAAIYPIGEREKLEHKHGDKYPTVIRTFRGRWEQFVPFLSYPQEIRRMLYTTNAVGLRESNYTEDLARSACRAEAWISGWWRLRHVAIRLPNDWR